MAAPSYSHGTSAVPLLGETIGENLRRTVERHPDREALVVRHQGFRASYRELWDLSGRAAKGLLARGVARGDRVGIWAPNRFEWVVVQYATARLGAILVNINPAYKAMELEYALNQSGVSVLLLSRGFRQTDYRELLSEVRDRCGPLREALVLEDDWEELLAGGEDVVDEDLFRREASLQFDDPINIQYTSGTTGRPKGATLSHHNILNNAFNLGEYLRYTEADRVCIPVPFYHCFGMVMGNLACTSRGACMVVPAEAFDPLAMHVALRSPHDVHRRARSPPFRRVRPDVAADGRDGGSSLSGRGDAEGTGPDAHAGDHDRLRNDGDVAALDADDDRRSSRKACRDRGTRLRARGDQDRRPGDGSDRPARCPG
jgi:fatty-acyl-CoA synthase